MQGKEKGLCGWPKKKKKEVITVLNTVLKLFDFTSKRVFCTYNL